MPTRIVIPASTATASNACATPLQLLNDLMQDEFQCPICLDTYENTHVDPDCNHRICGECVKRSIDACRHECPPCKTTLRPDQHFDRIVS